MLKKFIFFLCIIFLFTGCANKTNYEEITFSSWGSVTEVEVIKKIISDFEKQNPNIKVKFMHFPQNYFQKIHLLFAANTPPDVIFVNNIYLPQYTSKLEDLSNLINNNLFYFQSIDAMSINGKVYAVPRDVSNLVFYINTDILEQNGMVLPNSNWSLNDLFNIATTVTNKSVYGIGYEPSTYFAMPYINYFGEELSVSNYVKLAGLKFYKKLPQKVAPNRSEVGSATIAQMFLDGRIAMYLSGRWMYPKITEKAKFNWIVLPFPYGIKGVPCDSSGWAISKVSKHKEASKRFVSYISSSKSAEYFTKTGLVVPANLEAIKLLDNNIHNERAFIEAARKSAKNPVRKDYKKITDKIDKTLEY